jgi:hypothetical protein
MTHDKNNNLRKTFMTHQLAIKIALGICVSFCFSTASNAATIYTNLGPANSYDITQGNFVGNDFVGDNLAEGDTFTPTTNAVFGSLDVALSCAIASCPDPYTVSLVQDTGSDSPGAVIESFVGSGTSLGQLNVDNPLSVFNSVLTPTLTAGTQYWVTISSDLNDSIIWNSNTTGDTSDQAISSDGGATWFSPSGLTPGAYQINSTVSSVITPEPGAFVFLTGALPLLFVTRRFASRNKN